MNFPIRNANIRYIETPRYVSDSMSLRDFYLYTVLAFLFIHSVNIFRFNVHWFNVHCFLGLNIISLFFVNISQHKYLQSYRR